MSTEVVIRAEKLGKRYFLAHQHGGRSRYTALRDVIADGVKNILSARVFSKDRSRRDAQEEFWALREVSFDVKRGEVIGIIGRNGAGKSTLLKILSRITEPTTGRVGLNGRVASLLEVGTGFHPELTGRENIFLNGAILGMTRIEIKTRFDEIVDFAEVEKFLDMPVKQYSSGMYMRLAFAVAAHMQPEILIVDEVLAVGDAEFQKKSLGKMHEVGRSGRTVLFVSHNMNAVEQLCSRAILLNEGQKEVDSDDVRQVIKQHLFGGSDEAVEIAEWENRRPADPDSFFRPARFYLGDSAGRPLRMPAPNDREIWLHAEFDLQDNDPAFNIGYGVYSEDGHLLYWSFSTDESEEQWPKLEKGFQRVCTRIPSRLLNEGVYRVELLASLHCRKWLLEPGVDAPSVFLRIQGGLSDSPLWMARRPGLLGPVFPWRVVNLNKPAGS